MDTLLITLLKVGQCYSIDLGSQLIAPSAVANALSHFTNITLSSFYFDITKDCLYADAVDGEARRGVVTVLNHVRLFSAPCRSSWA